jgi:hypothetical protein
MWRIGDWVRYGERARMASDMPRSTPPNIARTFSKQIRLKFKPRELSACIVQAA